MNHQTRDCRGPESPVPPTPQAPEALPMIDRGPVGQGIQVLRMVIDTIQECNLRCTYCHPGKVWLKQHLPWESIRDVLAAAEYYGVLEVVLSGGEITMHPEFSRVLDATNVLNRTTSTLITNGTTVTPAIQRQLAESNVGRICTSVDGVDEETHASARGRNYRATMRGLRLLNGCGKPVTVISVVHKQNIGRVLELSEFLAESGLASQHHLCSPSYSGTARDHYGALRLDHEDYIDLQRRIEEAHAQLLGAGLFLTFNSFWPATGLRSNTAQRTLTLQQVVEQCKDTYVIVRSDGEFRLTSAAWGRETVGSAALGNVTRDQVDGLLSLAHSAYRGGAVRQLPREVEAMHKFQLGGQVSSSSTDALIDSQEDPRSLTRMVPIVPLAGGHLMEPVLDWQRMRVLAREIAETPADFRIAQHCSGAYLIFGRSRSHVTLLTEAEFADFMDLCCGARRVG